MYATLSPYPPSPPPPQSPTSDPRSQWQSDFVHSSRSSALNLFLLSSSRLEGMPRRDEEREERRGGWDTWHRLSRTLHFQADAAERAELLAFLPSASSCPRPTFTPSVVVIASPTRRSHDCAIHPPDRKLCAPPRPLPSSSPPVAQPRRLQGAVGPSRQARLDFFALSSQIQGLVVAALDSSISFPTKNPDKARETSWLCLLEEWADSLYECA